MHKCVVEEKSAGVQYDSEVARRQLFLEILAVVKSTSFINYLAPSRDDAFDTAELRSEDKGQSFIQCISNMSIRTATTSTPAWAIVTISSALTRSTKPRRTGAYLISGGLGGLGLLVAEWLAEQGASHIILLTRRTIQDTTVSEDPRWKRLIKGVDPTNLQPPARGGLVFHQPGYDLAVVTCDVADLDDLSASLQSVLFTANFPEIVGVFHCAGISKDAPVIQTTDESIESILNGKVDGAKNLDLACERFGFNKSMDFFVMFSSMAGLFGNFGQSIYAAANASLDGLVGARRKSGYPALSIQWGPWIEQGMAAALNRHFSSAGIKGISNDLGLRVLEDLLIQSESPQSSPVVCCMPIEWPIFIQRYGDSQEMTPSSEDLLSAVPQFFRNIDLKRDSSNAYSPTSNGYKTDGVSAFILSLVGKTDDEILDEVKSIVVEAALRVVGDESITAESIPMSEPLLELGIDSLGAVEFRNHLTSQLGVKLPATTLFDYPTLEAISDFVVTQVKPLLSTESVLLSTSFSIRKSLGQSKPADFKLAIVGMACRLPGHSNSLNQFWNMLSNKTNCVSEVPLTRFNAERFFDSDPNALGCSYVKRAAFITDAEMFDNKFFHISDAEVALMDPQQRLILEVAYDACVSGGFNRKSLNGKDYTVHIGCSNFDWHYMDANNNPYTSSPFSCTGGSMCLVSNRVSYLLGLRGPSMTIDTACSSSLISLDAAVHKVLDGASDGALVGGVNLMLSPQLFIGFSKTRMLAPDCRCKTFDARADGYARGEGAAAALLLPCFSGDAAELDGIVPNGSKIFGYVLGSAVNHVGRGSTLTAPNGPSQKACIAQALSNAKLPPDAVCMIECHGTGTSLGDPIETRAIATLFGPSRVMSKNAGGGSLIASTAASGGSTLALGALKTNIGHLEGSAGIAGFVKLVLSLMHRTIPPNLHFNSINPHIDFGGLPVTLPQNCTPLEVSKSHVGAIGGVSSFGFGGANGHVIVEGAPTPIDLTSLESREWQRSAHRWTTTSHPLIGRRVVDPVTGVVVYATEIREDIRAIFADHVIRDVPLVPGAAFVELLASATLDDSQYKTMSINPCSTRSPWDETRIVNIRKMDIITPIEISIDHSTSDHSEKLMNVAGPVVPSHLRVVLGNGEAAVVTDSSLVLNDNLVASSSGHSSVLHVWGEIDPNTTNEASLPTSRTNSTFVDAETAKAASVNLPATANEIENLYARMREVGLCYGPRFRALQSLHLSPNKDFMLSRLEITVPPIDSEQGFFFHPSILDGALQSGAVLLANQGRRGLFVPTHVEDAWLAKLPDRKRFSSEFKSFWSYVTFVPGVDVSKDASLSVSIFTSAWTPICRIGRLRFHELDLLHKVAIPTELLWETVWNDAAREPAVEKHLDDLSSLDEASYDLRSSFDEGKAHTVSSKITFVLPNVGIDDIVAEDMEEPQDVNYLKLSSFMNESQTASECDHVVYNLSSVFTPETNLEASSITWSVTKFIQSLPDHWTVTSDSVHPPVVVIVTRGTMDVKLNDDILSSKDIHHIRSQMGVRGLVKTAVLEMPLLCVKNKIVPRLVWLDLSYNIGVDSVLWLLTKMTPSLLTELKDERELFLTANGRLKVPRLKPSPIICRGPIEVFMRGNQRGALSNLAIRPQSSSARQASSENSVEIRVRAIGLNFRDVLNVMGLYPGDPGELLTLYFASFTKI